MSDKAMGIADGAQARGDNKSGLAGAGEKSLKSRSTVGGTSFESQAKEKGPRQLSKESGNDAVKKAVNDLLGESPPSEVDLRSSGIGVKGIQAIAAALLECESVTFVNLDRNRCVKSSER